MQKKVLAVAVAAALAAPAVFAKSDEGISGDENVVELYGKAYPEINRPYSSGATPVGTAVCTFCAAPAGTNAIITRNEMESSNSRFGVRGQEKLGGGLKAIFQLETEFLLDSNNSAFAQRDSFVGLDHRGFGTIKLGRMDTPFKTYGDEISFLGISSGNFVSSSNVLRKTGFGTSSASSFHLRRQNAVQYESPVVAGFDAALQYSTDETDTATRKAHVWSGGVRWHGGPFTAALAYEQHWDLFGGSRNVATASMSNFNDQSVRSRDKAWQAMVIWQIMKGQRIEVDYNQKKYDENATVAGRFQHYQNNAYEVIWDARWNEQWRTMVQYVKASKGSCSRVSAVCSTDGLDGSQLNVGFAYYLSKRTYFFVMGAWLKNGFSARYNNEAQQSPNDGEDLREYSVGIAHSF